MVASTSPLVSALSEEPHTFLQPSLPLYTDTLAYLQHALDPLAADVSSVQQQRLKEARKKRKRGQHIAEDAVLRLKQIHTDGFSVEQIWEQARRVMDAARWEAERGLENAVVHSDGQVLPDVAQDVEMNGVDHDAADDSLGEEGVDYEVEGIDGGEEDWDGVDDFDQLEGDGAEEGEDINMDDGDMEDQLLGDDEHPEEFVGDKFGLNDGFFSIDNFNKQSEFLEQQDARGDDDGAASDEEDVDWDSNPLVQAAAPLGANGAAEEWEDDEDDGPTFGEPDAESEDDEAGIDEGEMDAMGGLGNTNDVMYADFFAPPAQKKRKNKKGRPNPHNFPESIANGAQVDDDEVDIDRARADVHRDLFEDSASEEDDGDEEQQALDPADPKSRRSTHERRKAALAEEIRKLEAENVAKREWTLSGEARAADRPINSLLEEDLDFERAGKPVPVITAEVSESIEELIKRRILAHDFQDIIRRRPDDLATGKDSKRGRLDVVLDDSKAKKGLAEEYEEEHLRQTDPNFVDAKSERQKKEEKEIEALWKKVCSDLDGLSSWHFRPKQPAPSLDIRVDAPAIGMEDARPSAGGEIAGASQLAPQEVYRAGEKGNRAADEVIGKSGLPAGREEMSREERKRRRRREKERVRKAGGNEGGKKVESKQNGVVGDLKKGGVKVIGKKGDVRDVDGQKAKVNAVGQLGAGQYKL